MAGVKPPANLDLQSVRTREDGKPSPRRLASPDDGALRAMSLGEIGVVLGIGRERVRQIEVRARQKLHAELGRRGYVIGDLLDDLPSPAS
jgi:hypothetical protein